MHNALRLCPTQPLQVKLYILFVLTNEVKCQPEFKYLGTKVCGITLAPAIKDNATTPIAEKVDHIKV